MPLISMFPCSAGSGASIDYNSRPQIDFDGKWIKPFVEFYDGEPYWEAWFFSSGTLAVNGTYTADAWLIGGGRTGKVGSGAVDGGNGHVTTTTGITLSGQVPITIGAGAATYVQAAGTTSVGSLASAPGANSNTDSGGPFYRFSDPEKQNEAGDSYKNPNSSSSYGRWAYGGWLKWKNENTEYGEADGYGAASIASVDQCGHQGAAVIRIKI